MMTTHEPTIEPKETEEASLALLSLAHIAETHPLHAEAKVLTTLRAGVANVRAAPATQAHKPSPAKVGAARPAPSASAAAVRDFWALCEGQYKLVSAHGAVHSHMARATTPAIASPQPTAPRAPAAGAKRKAEEPNAVAVTAAAAASGAKRCRWKGPPKVLQQQGMTLAADGSARFSGPAAPLPPVKAPTTPPAAMRCRWKGPQLLPQGPSRPASGAESPRSVMCAL